MVSLNEDGRVDQITERLHSSVNLTNIDHTEVVYSCNRETTFLKVRENVEVTNPPLPFPQVFFIAVKLFNGRQTLSDLVSRLSRYPCPWFLAPLGYEITWGNNNDFVEATVSFCHASVVIQADVGNMRRKLSDVYAQTVTAQAANS